MENIITYLSKVVLACAFEMRYYHRYIWSFPNFYCFLNCTKNTIMLSTDMWRIHYFVNTNNCKVCIMCVARGMRHGAGVMWVWRDVRAQPRTTTERCTPHTLLLIRLTRPSYAHTPNAPQYLKHNTLNSAHSASPISWYIPWCCPTTSVSATTSSVVAGLFGGYHNPTCCVTSLQNEQEQEQEQEQY